MTPLLILKKFHFIATPIGFVVSLTVVAIVLFFLKCKRLSMGVAFAALLSLWVCSTPWISIWAYKYLISDVIIETPLADITEADAIVVFSWMKPIGKNEEAYFNSFSDYKLLRARKIYNKLKIPIFVSSSQFPAPNEPAVDEIPFAKKYLLSIGIPHDKIFIAKPARSSYEGSAKLKKMLDNRGDIKKVILIENDLRMPRKYLSLKKLYENQAVEIIPFSNVSGTKMKKPTYEFSQWIPQVKAIERTTKVLHEWCGLQAHRLMGWI